MRLTSRSNLLGLSNKALTNIQNQATTHPAVQQSLQKNQVDCNFTNSLGMAGMSSAGVSVQGLIDNHNL